MNPKIATVVPVPKLQKTTSRRKAAYHEFRTISCRYANGVVAVQKSETTNFYDVLSLCSDDHQNVSFDEIKKAYRNLALHLQNKSPPNDLLSLGRLMRHFLIQFRVRCMITSWLWSSQLRGPKSKLGLFLQRKIGSPAADFPRKSGKNSSGLMKMSQLRMEIRTKKYAGHEM